VALGILKRFGLRADSVANGAAALSALETIPYDLILMDVQMPEMDGIEATRLIRNAERQMDNKDTDPHLPIPIIAMTAHAMQSDRERCLDAGMNAYIPKPVSPDALAEALERWLPKEHDQSSQKQWAFPNLITQQSKSDTLPVWDKAGFMQRIMGDEELAQTVLQAFLKDIPRQMEALRARLEAGDASEAERLAHSIKGASANIGAEELRVVALGMEKAVAIDDFQSAKDAFESLRQSFEELQRAIKKDIMQEE
jgi:CheY-like chemotaxis protein/HPt (histidine-containing phosphotransfer) domain-containing protein